jgi:erythronate-4-phosphate dehydrogenase
MPGSDTLDFSAFKFLRILMLIVADENIARVGESFGVHGEVRLLPGRSLDATTVRDADILLVRSVTPVGRELLEGSRVRFVGSATIGVDHLDTAWLGQQGIVWANAPGSNATAVVEYVLGCLAALDGVLERLASGGVVGVIGLGNVGARLVTRLRRLGIRCVGYDPLLAAGPTDSLPLCDLDQVLAADVVCCHTPLTHDGAYPTFHLLDAARLRQLRPGAVLLNAGRGGAVDNAALLDLLAVRPDLRVVLDVWEGEPRIDRALLAAVALGTPHIAGYSVDGKLAGTRQVLAACSQHFGWSLPAADLATETTPHISIDDELSGMALLRHAIAQVYDVRMDDQRLRGRMEGVSADVAGAEFDNLRKTYPARREFAAVRIDNWGELHAGNRSLLLALGFSAPMD